MVLALLIELKDINFHYSLDDDFSLRNIDLNIRESEIFGLLGPSGAGKSTIQKILTKLIQDFEGEITVFGKNIQEFGREYYERIGVSFELPNHYLKLTASENLHYFKSLYPGKTLDIDNLLELVGLKEHKDQMVENFSKGMKNRLTLARSLLNDPEILFLDEPTAGLDPVNKDVVIYLINTLQSQGKTIVLTTHDMQVVEMVCNRVGFIIDGEIKTIGEPEKLKQEYGSNTVRVEYNNNGKSSEYCNFPLKTLGSNNEFQRIIQNYEIRTIHSQEASLDTVFIEITGRSLT